MAKTYKIETRELVALAFAAQRMNGGLHRDNRYFDPEKDAFVEVVPNKTLMFNSFAFEPGSNHRPSGDSHPIQLGAAVGIIAGGGPTIAASRRRAGSRAPAYQEASTHASMKTAAVSRMMIGRVSRAIRYPLRSQCQISMRMIFRIQMMPSNMSTPLVASIASPRSLSNRIVR